VIEQFAEFILQAAKASCSAFSRFILKLRTAAYFSGESPVANATQA